MRTTSSSRKISRRAAFGAMVTAPGLAVAASADDGAEVEHTLRRFLAAFERDDLAVMEAAFDPEATSFDPVVAGATTAGPPDLAALHRQPGMPPTMRALVQSTPKPGSGPPYRRLNPKDLLVQVEGSVAICTFHLEGPGSLARRTIVLVRRAAGWRILHIHASNAVTS